MGTFTDESILLIKNWEVVRSILAAEKRLCSELSKFLYSIESDLRKTDWWQNNWIFTKRSGSQVSISKREWKVDDDFAVWIGVENFVPESLFGHESQAQLYVWVLGKWYNLARKLAVQLSEEESDIIGEIDRKTSSGYVIRHAVSPCFPEEIDGFEDMTRNQIVNFFTHYARVLDKHNELIKEFLVED